MYVVRFENVFYERLYFFLIKKNFFIILYFFYFFKEVSMIVKRLFIYDKYCVLELWGYFVLFFELSWMKEDKKYSESDI